MKPQFKIIVLTGDKVSRGFHSIGKLAPTCCHHLRKSKCVGQSQSQRRGTDHIL